MTAQEYLEELDASLISLPDEERELAVSFYREYFEDAGADKEQDVINELGKPLALAKSIIREESAFSKSVSYAKYRESKSLSSSKPIPNSVDNNIETDQDIMPPKNNAADDKIPEGQTPPHTQFTSPEAADEKFGFNGAADREPKIHNADAYDNYKSNYRTTNENSYTKTENVNSDKNPVMLIIGIILFLTLLPFTISIVLCFAAFAIAAAGCAIGFIGLIIAAIVAFITTTALTGISYIGAALICGGLAFLFAVLAIIGLAKFTPWAIKCFVGFIKRHS